MTVEVDRMYWVCETCGKPVGLPVPGNCTCQKEVLMEKLSDTIYACVEAARKQFPQQDFRTFGAWDLEHHLKEAYRYAALLERVVDEKLQ